jgi:hypothetical protein
VLPRDPAAGGGDAALRRQYRPGAGRTPKQQAYYEALKQRHKVSDQGAGGGRIRT